MARIIVPWLFCFAVTHGCWLLANHFQGQEIVFSAFFMGGLAGVVLSAFDHHKLLWPFK